MPPQWRLFRLIRLTGWTVAEIRATPAGVCDWLLAIENVVNAPNPQDGD